MDYGHRNPQGLAIDKVTGELWSDEHGPQGGDELNLIHRGGNYGWPSPTLGSSVPVGRSRSTARNRAPSCQYAIGCRF